MKNISKATIVICALCLIIGFVVIPLPFSSKFVIRLGNRDSYHFSKEEIIKLGENADSGNSTAAFYLSLHYFYWSDDMTYNEQNTQYNFWLHKAIELGSEPAREQQNYNPNVTKNEKSEPASKP